MNARLGVDFASMVAAKGKPPKAPTGKQLVGEAIAAFERLTGKHPTEAEWEWKVFFEAIQAVVQPTPDRARWVKDCTKRHRATDGVLKARALAEFQRRAAPHGGWKQLTPDQVRRVLGPFDDRFAKLSDKAVQAALARRGPSYAIACLCLSVGAMGVSGHPNAEETIRKVAAAFRQAEQRAGNGWE